MAGIDLHPGQSEVYKALFVEKMVRFGVVCAARGWGKSYFAAVTAMTAVYELLTLDYSVPNKNVYIVAPTYDQVTDIYYPILAYDLGAESMALTSSRDRGRFIFHNNVELRLVSFEAVERLRGKGAYFVVGDELSSWKKGIGAKSAWESVIQPCIVTRWSEARAAYFNASSPGRGLMISTPKGYNFFHEMFHYPERDERWGSFHYDYTQSPYIDPAEIERIKHTIAPIEFASEYLASFKESGNNVFYTFDRDVHVTNEIPDFYIPKEGRPEDVHVNIDFNVGIMASSMFAVRGKQMHFLDELQGHPDTEQLAITLKKKYIDKGHKVYAYPDPTGRSRKSSAPIGQTDFTILKDNGIQTFARKGSPGIVDSVAAVNKQLMTAAGDVGMYFHPRCVQTIKSMERTKWVENNPDIAVIDKSESIEHFSDGVRYGTEYLFPVRGGSKKSHRGFKF